MISALPVSGAWHPNTIGAHCERPRISFNSASLSWPWPCPPSSGPKCVAHKPLRRTSSFSGSITLRRLSSSGTNCRCGNAKSSGSTSSRTNSSAQSSTFWYSGSVSKSHAIAGLLSIECDDDLVRGAGRRRGLERIVDVVERDRVADDHRVLLPVGDQIFGDVEDLVRVAHRPDDGDLVAHQVEEVHRHGLLVHRDDTELGAGLRGRQRGLDDGGCARGVEVDVGACFSAEHRRAFSV